MEIGGKNYLLVLNTGVMAALEEHFSTPQHDVTWDQLWLRVLRGSAKTVRALIWAMLLPHQPTITLEQASALIDEAGGFEGLTKILSQAGKHSTPDPKDIKDLGVPKRPQRAQTKTTRRGTGGASSSTRGASV
jgi:hypothetical protein